MSYEDLLREAVQAYTERLRRIVRLQGSPALRIAAGALIETIEVAWVRRTTMTVLDCHFTAATLHGMHANEQLLLLNEHALGFGRPDAATIFIASEPAYQVGPHEGDVNFCLESCAQLAVLLAEGDAGVVAKLSGGQLRPAEPRPFHLYPNDHERVSPHPTWASLAKIVGCSHEPGATPGLGDLCYQLDLSAFPGQRSATGRAPTRERLAFLETAMATFAATARTVVFHGKLTEWEVHRAPLIQRFLGHAPAASDWIDDSEPQRPLRHVTVGDRRVIVTRALSGQGMRDELCTRIARLVQRGPAPRRRIITVPPPARRAAAGTAPPANVVLDLDRHRLLQLCLAQGLETNRQDRWTQVGPRGATGAYSRDPRLFYVNHDLDVVELRRYSGPNDLMSRARDAGGDIDNGQIVARIPVTLFTELDWLRLIRHNT